MSTIQIRIRRLGKVGTSGAPKAGKKEREVGLTVLGKKQLKWGWGMSLKTDRSGPTRFCQKREMYFSGRKGKKNGERRKKKKKEGTKSGGNLGVAAK